MRTNLLLLASFLVACGGAVSEPISDKSQQSASAEKGDDATGAPANGAASESGDECTAGARRACLDANGRDTGSIQDCETNGPGDGHWGACYDNGNSSTPLVLVFDGAPVTFDPFTSSSGATFDLAGDGASHVTSWPTARTPWLAIDRDGNGRIDDGGELFGSMTRLSTGVRARNGFEALAELDSNHDGAITAEDEGFAKLLLWSDSNGDRTSSTSEQTAASERVIRIELAYRIGRVCTNGGDCEIERAKLVYRDVTGAERTGEVVDVHLRHR